MKYKKSQASLEFLAFLGIALVILIVFTVINLTYLNNNLKQRETTSAQDLTKFVKNEINLASRVEPGYVRIVNLPATLDNKDYILASSLPGLTCSSSSPSLTSREVLICFTRDNPRKDYTESLATKVNGFVFIPDKVNSNNNKITIGKCNDESVKVISGSGIPCA